MEQPSAGTGPETTGNDQLDAERNEQLREEHPRIYVASLTDYNDGRLHGAWIDAAQESAVLHEHVDAMLAASPTGHAEEFAIHDFAGFGHYRPGEYEPLERVSRIACGVAQHGPAFAAWAEHCAGDDEALERFEDAYLGDWDSAEAYADDLIGDLGWQELLDRHLPDSLHPYITIDTAGFARDLELSGDIAAIEHPSGV